MTNKEILSQLESMTFYFSKGKDLETLQDDLENMLEIVNEKLEAQQELE